MKRLWQIPIETTENLEINMAPLIDMVFLLLIFFIVSSRLAEDTGLAVQRPRAASAELLAAQSVYLVVTPSGMVRYGGDEFPPARVRGLVARLAQAAPTPVVVVADAACPAGALVRVIDECRLAGVANVSLAATKEPVP